MKSSPGFSWHVFNLNVFANMRETIGAFIWNGSEWLQLVSSAAVEDFFYQIDISSKSVTIDRGQADTFYVFQAGQGLFSSVNGGRSWKKVYSGNITSNVYGNAELLSVPGEAGNLFFSGGFEGSVGTAFMRSTNGGAAWIAVPNVNNVLAFGFGAPKASGGYPSIYLVGEVNSQYGAWVSTDNAQTWSNLGSYPNSGQSMPSSISGDPNVFGAFYIGFDKDGYVYYGP